MKKIIILLLLCSPIYADDPPVSEQIRVPEWIEFQNTQKNILEEQQKFLGDLAEMRQNIREINIGFINWKDQVVQTINAKEVHCDALKTKYSPQVEYPILGLAFCGLLAIIKVMKEWVLGKETSKV